MKHLPFHAVPRISALVAALALGTSLADAADAPRAAGDRPKDAQGGKAEVRAPKSAGIKFSKSRGFQTEAFDLELGPGEVSGEIRYTVDGSAPGKGKGAVYQKPIRIAGTTIVRAAVVSGDGNVSRVQTHSYLFPSDIIRQSPDGLPPAGWPYSWGGNVVDYGMDPSVVDDPKYRDVIQPALQSLPSYSLSMDLDDLFGEARGIYSHSDQEGREWERPASVELLQPMGRKGFQEDCGVRIRGGFSSGGFNPKHAFRLFFRKEYGNGKLKYPVFGEGGAKEFDSLDLRCSQNYSWNIGGDARALFIRDQFNRDLQIAMGQPGARGNFCHLFLNGQYWGLFNTCERPEASYAEAYFGGKKEDYDVVKTGGIGGGGGGFSIAATDGTMDAWNRLHELAKADLSDNAAYFRLLGRKPDGSLDPEGEALLDPTNLIDYLLVIWYGGNLDAPVTRFGGNRAPNNWHALRNRTTRDGFKFFVWDAEHTFLELEEDRTGPFPGGDQAETSHPQWLYQRCTANAEFRVLLSDRIHRHLAADGVLSPASVRERFERRLREIEAAVVCESARWGDVGGGFPFGPPGMQRPTRLGPDGEPRPVARTRDLEWRAEAERWFTEFIPKRTDIVWFQLWRQGLVSDLPAPVLKPSSGPLAASEAVSIQVGAGEVWYTTDGLDPRQVGGSPSATAKKWEGPLKVSGRTVVQSRVRTKGEWGPLVRGEYAALEAR
ncbi:MAG: CotH kinase family protein [Dermatophilaceae bacterium]